MVNAEPPQPLVRMVLALLDLWRLTAAQKAAVLGIDCDSMASLMAGAEVQLNSADRERFGHLLGIHRRLRLLFPMNLELAYSWMTSRNRAFSNLTPVELIGASGVGGLLAVTDYLHCKLDASTHQAPQVDGHLDASTHPAPQVDDHVDVQSA